MIKVTKYLIVCLVVLTIIQLTACEKNEESGSDPEPEVELSVDLTSLSFTAEGGVQSIAITSNVIWTMDYTSGSWARSSLQTTRGNATVQITADANESTDDRQMTFKLTAEDTDPIEITVTQEAGEGVVVDEEPVLEDYIDPDNTGMRSLTSLQLSEEMGIGWNLGNSLEAILSNNGVLTGGETSWGNPVITKQLIDSVKEAGFNTIRMPVSWSHKLDDEATFDISYEWKLRVEEVVNYALDNDMYVIINMHWDGGWLDHPFYEDQDALNERLGIMWKQIAKFFRDYDDHLLFAGTNEVHIENDYSTPSSENVEVQNSFNQTFVNTVRATGGKNSYRHLVVQTFNTNIAHGVNFFTVPEDEVEDRLMVEVHFYDPYQFALEENDNTYLWGQDYIGNDAHSGWGDEDWVDDSFADAKAAFVDQGYPVVMGEFGAILKSDLTGDAYQLHVEARNYYLNYVTSKALENGIVPVYWDNGHAGNYGFGLFNRVDGSTAHTDALEAIISAKQ